MLFTLLLSATLAGPPISEPPDVPEIDCDGSEEFCATLQKAVALGEQLESVVEREVFEGVERVHHNEVVARKRLKPRYPVEASVLFKEPTRCAFRVFIDERGYPYDLRFLNCPSVFHASMAEALQTARWEGVRVDGQRVKATFATSITFE